MGLGNSNLKEISEALMSNTTLQRLLFGIMWWDFLTFSLSNNAFGDEGIEFLASSLPLNSSLTEISFESWHCMLLTIEVVGGQVRTPRNTPPH